MFGYIRLNKPESKIREYEYYRAVYCGLCRSLGKCTGRCSRMMLSYDMTFMALVRLSLEGITPTIGRRRCIVHPLRKHPTVMPPKGSREEQIFTLCACATTLLSYHKLKDDLADEKGFKRLRAAVLRPILSPSRRRAAKQYAPLEETITEQLSKLSEWERGDGTSVDLPAEMFGKLLGEVLAFGLSDAERRIAYEIGFHIGKWVYLLDAADDYAEDIKRKRYNPLVHVYGETLDLSEREALMTALTAELCDAEKGFDLLDYPDCDIEGVIRNIIYIGMPQTAKSILLPCCEKGTANERSV